MRPKYIREKISKSLKGRNLSEDHKRNIAKALTGNKNCLGKTLSEEHKDKISQSCKGGNKTSYKPGERNSPETEFKSGNKPWNKDVGQFGPGKIKRGNYIGVLINDGLIMEHRFVMEKHLGRPLNKQEVVHHINGDCTDNRLENLKLFANQSEHISFHRLADGNTSAK